MFLISKDARSICNRLWVMKRNICPQSPLHELIRNQHNDEYTICWFSWQCIHCAFKGLHISIHLWIWGSYLLLVHCMSFEEIFSHCIGVNNVFNVQTKPCGLHFKIICYKFIAISHPVVSLLSCIRQDWISRILGLFKFFLYTDQTIQSIINIYWCTEMFHL